MNTTVTVISTLQNSVVSYNTLELTYLLIVGIAAQVSRIPRTDTLTTELIANVRQSASTHFGGSNSVTDWEPRQCLTPLHSASFFSMAGA